MNTIYPSIFNDVIGPVMRGPSSSHSAGSLRIGRLLRDLMNADIKEVTVNGKPEPFRIQQVSTTEYRVIGKVSSEVAAQERGAPRTICSVHSVVLRHNSSLHSFLIPRAE